MTDHFELSIMVGTRASFRLRGDVVQEIGHRTLGVEHALVHVDVDEIRAAAHLVERDLRRRPVVAGAHEPSEARGPGDVGPLADHDEVGIGTDRQRFQTSELGVALINHNGHHAIVFVVFVVSVVSFVVNPSGRQGLDSGRDRTDMVRRRPAAAADDVQEAAVGEIAQRSSGIGG
jgi:hypothetical protein